ncbi:MAG: DUF86 domain-containing protein [Elusimicrobia bacterium]|nr:DUF86 domain-containing protein [Elusimicrobiota bacterium]
MKKDVLNHLRDLEENIRDWESYLQEMPFDKFLSDRFARHALLHAVTVALQAAIDIGNHWVTELTPQRPETYKAIADLLVEKKAVATTLGSQVGLLFGLRNVLIHKYQDLELKQLYQQLQAGPSSLKLFLALAKKRVQRK